jgi:hypothetical protein
LGMQGDKLGTVMIITVVLEYLVVAFSDNMLDYLAFNWYFWFVLGTACAIIVAQQREIQAEKTSPMPTSINLRNSSTPVPDGSGPSMRGSW